MATPATGLNIANLEKSVFLFNLGKATPDEVPAFKDRATGKLVAINTNSIASIACGLSNDAIRPRLVDFFNRNSELKKVIYNYKFLKFGINTVSTLSNTILCEN